jgi:hypothetical protein
MARPRNGKRLVLAFVPMDLQEINRPPTGQTVAEVNGLCVNFTRAGSAVPALSVNTGQGLSRGATLVDRRPEVPTGVPIASAKTVSRDVIVERILACLLR